MYNTPTLDGNAIFGEAVRMQHSLSPPAIALREFFGVNGTFSLFGGKRGRTFTVSGLLIASDVDSLNLAEGIWETYVDGYTHLLVDTRGRQWEDVEFHGDLQVSEDGPRPLVGYVNPDGSSWLALPYKAALIGLT